MWRRGIRRRVPRVPTRAATPGHPVQRQAPPLGSAQLRKGCPPGHAAPTTEDRARRSCAGSAHRAGRGCAWVDAGGPGPAEHPTSESGSGSGTPHSTRHPLEGVPSSERSARPTKRPRIRALASDAHGSGRAREAPVRMPSIQLLSPVEAQAPRTAPGTLSRECPAPKGVPARQNGPGFEP